MLGPLLFVLLSWSLYRQIMRQPGLGERWSQVKLSWMDLRFWMVVGLMFVNWAIESVKWQKQLEPLQKMNFIRAFRSVLAGCSITMLTPNRIGEYAGRILYINEENRIRAIPLTILGSISQLAVTMSAGTAGILYIRYGSGILDALPEQPWFLNGFILVLGFLSTLFLFLLFFKVHDMVLLISRIRFLKSFVKYLHAAESFTRKQLLRIIFLSFIRYLVFILQYALMIQVMHVDIPLAASAWLMTQFFMLMVLAPTIGFTELPVRATAGVAILGLFSNNILGIQAAIFAIWLINLVIPAMIGGIFILGVKMIKVP